MTAALRTAGCRGARAARDAGLRAGPRDPRRQPRLPPHGRSRDDGHQGRCDVARRRGRELRGQGRSRRARWPTKRSTSLRTGSSRTVAIPRRCTRPRSTRTGRPRSTAGRGSSWTASCGAVSRRRPDASSQVASVAPSAVIRVSIGRACIVVRAHGPARRERDGGTRHRHLVRCLDDVEEVPLPHQRVLRDDSEAHRLDLVRDLAQPVRILPEGRPTAGAERAQHRVGRHRRTLPCAVVRLRGGRHARRRAS